MESDQLKFVKASEVLTDEELWEIAQSDISWGDARQVTLIRPQDILETFDTTRMPQGIEYVCLEL